MYELPPNDPLVRARPFNSITGSELTLGAVQKLAVAADENRAALAKLLAKLNATIDDLDRRIASVESEVKAQIAGAAAGGETLAQRLARLNPRR
jgi:ParB-like chromosome segregation protein Spo0J